MPGCRRKLCSRKAGKPPDRTYDEDGGTPGAETIRQCRICTAAQSFPLPVALCPDDSPFFQENVVARGLRPPSLYQMEHPPRPRNMRIDGARRVRSGHSSHPSATTDPPPEVPRPEPPKVPRDPGPKVPRPEPPPQEPPARPSRPIGDPPRPEVPETPPEIPPEAPPRSPPDAPPDPGREVPPREPPPEPPEVPPEAPPRTPRKHLRPRGSRSAHEVPGDPLQLQ